MYAKISEALQKEPELMEGSWADEALLAFCRVAVKGLSRGR